MTSGEIFRRYQERQKKKTIKMLKELIKRLENGSFVVKTSGFWTGNMNNEFTFRIDIENKDTSENMDKFE